MLGKYEIISRVEQDISLVPLLTREISLSTLGINFIFPYIPCIVLYLLNYAALLF